MAESIEIVKFLSVAMEAPSAEGTGGTDFMAGNEIIMQYCNNALNFHFPENVRRRVFLLQERRVTINKSSFFPKHCYFAFTKRSALCYRAFTDTIGLLTIMEFMDYFRTFLNACSLM